ncbi:MAG: glutamine synthetase family protein [Pseudomonadota bacterium]
MSAHPAAAAGAEAIRAARATHPDLAWAEVFVTDLNGLQRGKLVPIESLDKVAKGGLRMPVSTLGLDILGEDVAGAGIAIERGDPDGPLIPVPGAIGPMLWADRPTLQVPCVLWEGDAPCAYDPRAVLGAQVEALTAQGLSATMAFELEFYLIDPTEPRPPIDEHGRRLPETRDQIYELSVLRGFRGLMEAIIAASHALGAPAETAIAEFGAGQFELNLRHVPDPLAAADHLMALKRVIRGCARGQGLDASFMAKPYGEKSGSGLHVHVSLADREGRGVFDAGEGPVPAPRAGHALAGLTETMPDAMLIWAPHQNSYRRPVPGSYAPMVAAWGLDNRGAALRMPETVGPGARIEHRVAGADANPYLVGAAILAGMVHGFDRGAPPPPPVASEAKPDQGPDLPLEWRAAEVRLSASKTLQDRLGAEFVRVFTGVKRQERAKLLARVSDVEYETYLRTV